MKTRSLTLKLTFAFLALSVSVLILSTFVDIVTALKTERRTIAENQYYIAQYAANTVKSFVHEKIRLLEATVRLSDLSKNDSQNHKLSLERLLGTERSFRSVLLLTPEKKKPLRVSRISKLLSPNISPKTQKEILAKIQNNGVYIGPVYIDSVTGEPIVKMAVAVKDLFGNINAALVAETNLKFMWDLVSNIKIGKSGLAYVVDKSGNLIAFHDISRVLSNENVSRLHEVAEYVSGKDCSQGHQQINISNGINGNYVVSDYVPLISPNWAVVIELPVLEAYQSVVQKIKVSAFSVFSVLIFAFLVGRYLSKKITKPIIDLRDATKEISLGNLDTNLSISEKNEIGELAKSFNQMVSDLKETTVSRDTLLEEVTARMELEMALNNAKVEAERASQAKGEFLANMSHEIRTPMNSIIGMNELALELATNDEQREYLEIVTKASEGLLGLINDILDFSKIEGGQIDLEEIPFDLQEIVESICDILSVRSLEKGLDLICHVDPTIDTWVVGDPTRLRQILINLGSNAIKFTSQGEICITVEPFEEVSDVKTKQKSVGLRFKVSDTGIGISEEALENVFDKFTQADGSTTRLYGGTGLGLSITKSLVEMMDGRIWVESTKGEGSIFQFVLYLAHSYNQENGLLSEKPSGFDNLSALIIDDNQTNRFYIGKTLTALNMEIAEAENSHAAIQLLQQKQFDFVLLECQDLAKSAFDVDNVNRIKNELLTNKTKLIIATSAGSVSKEKRRELGIDYIISKPVKQSRLYQVLSQARNEAANITKASDISLQPQNRVHAEERRILLVEDNEDNQKLATIILKKAGYTTDIAGNGKFAIAAVKEKEYDIILMDVQMPIMDGFQATKVIREYEQETGRKRIPIIALTAHAFQDYRDKCIANDMDDYITKPLKRKMLLATIEKWLQVEQVQNTAFRS